MSDFGEPGPAPGFAQEGFPSSRRSAHPLPAPWGHSETCHGGELPQEASMGAVSPRQQTHDLGVSASRAPVDPGLSTLA